MARCPASAGRPHFEVADIVRAHRAQLELQERLSAAQRRVLSAIELCRTAALGGHLVCRACGHEQAAYNSCRNRHCPKCQALSQERWIAARRERLLPVAHFHVVFTLPSELRDLACRLPRQLYGALFEAASETLLELGQTHLDATLGVTMVLHTWTRDLRFHPHVHAIVTAGGLDKNGCWRAASPKYLFPVKVMGALLQGKVMARLRCLQQAGALDGYDAFRDPQVFDRLMARLARHKWVVYAKRPFRRADHVLKYLGRYTHRTGIANSRLVNVTEQTVTFRTKNGKTATLAALEFMRRFIQHVLPGGLKKIRHYGLYAGSTRTACDSARCVLAPSEHVSACVSLSYPELLRELTGRDIRHCPKCGGELSSIGLQAPFARAPPPEQAA